LDCLDDTIIIGQDRRPTRKPS